LEILDLRENKTPKIAAPIYRLQTSASFCVQIRCQQGRVYVLRVFGKYFACHV